MNRAALALPLILLASPALAHLPHGEYGSFMAGATHPLFGLDHVLAMTVVGLWAGMIGGRAALAAPAAFVLAMVAGYALALAGVPLPAAEPMILASIVAFGLVAALALKLPPAAAAGLAGLFALFHGHAHGGEIGGAGALAFGLGFALATAGLHLAGIGLARAFSGAGARALGGLAAAAGAALAFS